MIRLAKMQIKWSFATNGAPTAPDQTAKFSWIYEYRQVSNIRRILVDN